MAEFNKKGSVLFFPLEGKGVEIDEYYGLIAGNIKTASQANTLHETVAKVATVAVATPEIRNSAS